MEQEHIDKLITKRLSNNITDDEDQLLSTWLNSNSQNQAYFNTFLETWNALDLTFDQLKVEDAYSRFEHQTVKSRASLGRFIAAAAVLIIALTTYFITVQDNVLETSSNRLESRLSDGSTIKLNRFSTLQYDFNDSERRLHLQGEGFFSVKKDGRPFIIETDHAEIRVLGTQFTVKNNGRFTEVNVLEGKVRFRSLTDTLKHLILTQNMASNSTHFAEASEQFRENVLWLQNRILFKDMQLTEILKRIEVEFDVNIEIENPTLKTKRISASLNDANVNQIIQAIANLVDADVTYDNNRYVIK